MTDQRYDAEGSRQFMEMFEPVPQEQFDADMADHLDQLGVPASPAEHKDTRASGRATSLGAPMADSSQPPLRAQPAYVEIVERKWSYDPASDTPAEHLIRPNEVRINGTPLLMPDGETVQVHGMGLKDTACVQVTLTLWAKRVVVESEQIEAGDGA